MTLQEALATGKKLRRVSTGLEYLTYEEYYDEYGIEREDVLATDWEVGNDTKEISEEDIKAAWNRARSSSLSVKPAGESPFYKAFIKELFG